MSATDVQRQTAYDAPLRVCARTADDRLLSLRRIVRLSVLQRPSIAAVCAGAIVAASFATQLAGAVPSSYWLLLGVIAAAGIAIAAAEPPRSRALSLNVFAIALAMRVLWLLGATLAGRSASPFLGPDSSTYWEGALDLVSQQFRLGVLAPSYYGTYDVGQYYLFASVIRIFGAHLVCLQLLNAGLSALAAPLAFAIGRLTVPRGARAIGLFVALSPSLTALSAMDLLKDPSVIFAMLLALLATVRLIRERAMRRLAGPGIAALAAFLYLRTTRFYAFAYIEYATLVAVALAILLCGRIGARRRAGLATLVFAFAAAEVIPIPAGWPPTPVLFAAQVGYVFDTPAMRFYSTGLVHRFRHGGEAEVVRAPQDLATMTANLARRVLGPFPWIPPQRWNLRTLQAGDYFLYPGMLLWYAMLPFVALGFALAGRATFRRSARLSTALSVLWLFTAGYMLQYLLINVSYRQREAIVPLLLVFAWGGIVYAWERPRLARWYGAYWAALAILAAAHLSVRALIRA
jgi:hypothetical protein